MSERRQFSLHRFEGPITAFPLLQVILAAQMLEILQIVTFSAIHRLQMLSIPSIRILHKLPTL